MATIQTKPDKEFLVKELIAERKEFLDLARQLTREEWNKPSLCTGWKVRDVFAHVIGVQSDFLVYFTTGGPNKANQKMVDRRANLTTDQLIAHFAAMTEKPSWVAKFMPALYIEDTWVHQQDVRWALGEEYQRTQNLVRVKIVLDMFGKVAPRKFPGVRFICTDMAWQVGEGQSVKGNSEAIAMALARRPASLERLEGEGKAPLAMRLK